MTRKDRKRYSREFKIEAIRQSNESGKPITQVARELDISVHHLYRWRDELAKHEESAFVGSGRSKPDAANDELLRLRRENARLREERDILKKSLTFFVKESEKGINL